MSDVVKLGPYNLNTIYTGDARELAAAIPDESVDLIFTDPIYDRIDDYRWLAETAARVLKADGNVLAWCSGPKQYKCYPAMAESLKFVLPLYYTVVAKTYRMIGYNCFVWTTPLLWFTRNGGKAIHRTIDTIVAHGSGKAEGNHKWNKQTLPFRRWIQDFTVIGAVIFDPFTGGGTVPAVCKMLGRHYLAFEIDPDTAEAARRRVRETQPPLFVPEPAQLRLEAIPA